MHFTAKGVRPFLSDKYDITKHPNYKYYPTLIKETPFNIEKYLSTRLKVKSNEVYDVYEIDLADENKTAD